MISDDEYLERIVAGINAVTSSAADVKWNQQIGGRQFDVVMTFSNAQLDFLVLIEVRNRTRKAEAEDVEAFIIKARDQQANKIVMVTAAGFQSGAVAVARRHGVALFTVEFDDSEVAVSSRGTTIRIPLADTDEEPTLALSEPRLGIAVEDVTLIYVDGRRRKLPTEQSAMFYYANKTMIEGLGSIESILLAEEPPKLGEGERTKLAVRLKPSRKTTPPDEFFFPRGKVKSLEYGLSGQIGREMIGNVRADPGIFTAPVVYTDVMSGRSARFRIEDLPLAFEEVESRRFYMEENPRKYFYCENISGD